jgi:hypothetical protein
MAEQLALLNHIWELLGSDLGLETQTILTDVLHGFPQSLQANARIIP